MSLFFFPFSLWFRGGSFTAASSKIIIIKRNQITWWVQSCAVTCFSQHLCKYLDGLLFIYTEKILCNVFRFILFIEPSPRNYNQASKKPNTHRNLLFVSCHIEWVKDVPCLFWAIRQIIHTCMNSFGQQLPSSASDRTEPDSGDHHMTPNTSSY